MTPGLMSLILALRAGGSVKWDGARPRLLAPRSQHQALLEAGDEIRMILDRARVFRRQFAEWTATDRTSIPLLVLTEAPEPRAGFCVSCGGPSSGWRCAICLTAVLITLGCDLVQLGQRLPLGPSD